MEAVQQLSVGAGCEEAVVCMQDGAKLVHVVRVHVVVEAVADQFHLRCELSLLINVVSWRRSIVHSRLYL